jgi:hypothetical protein
VFVSPPVLQLAIAEFWKMAIIPVRTFSVEIVTTMPHLLGAVCSAFIHGQNVGSIVRNGTDVGGKC